MPHTPSALPSVLTDLLTCPLCGADFTAGGGALRCRDGHAFDIARQGYVNLLGGKMHTGTADTAAMVQARVEFLAAGHYAPLAGALADAARSLCPPDGTVLEAGVGIGYYLAAVLDALPEARGLGLDLSKFALRRAARAHPRMGAVAWDVWQPLPVRSGSIDLLTDVFAPRNGPEFHRVLRPGGALLVVTPTLRHLAELRERTGLLSVDAAKEERLDRTLSGHFRLDRAETLEHPVTLTSSEAGNAVAMGPSAHHTDRTAASDEATGHAPTATAPMRVTASFRLSVYRPIQRPS